MLKVVVFDSGWGGEIFADYLEKRMPMTEIVRVIDWRRAPYSERGRTEICIMVDRALSPYMEEADVIVLASYAVTVAALSYLRWKYPGQKFVGFEPSLSEYVAKLESVKKIMVLATGIVEDSSGFQREMLEMGRKTVMHPDCASWIRRVDDGEMSEGRIRMELGRYAEEEVDAVLLYSTGFVDLKPELENIYGEGVVVDDFSRVAEETYAALKLSGGG